MKKIFLFTFLLPLLGFAQDFKLNNALVVGQLDQERDRYSLEIMLTEFFAENGVKAVPSLNVLKQGQDLNLLATDSLQSIVRNRGIDTYLLVSVRGYDRRFKPSQAKNEFATALDYGTLFGLYRDEVVSVSFEMFFYRDGQLVHQEMVKCGSISSRETVLKRFRKKLKRKLKKWS